MANDAGRGNPRDTIAAGDPKERPGRDFDPTAFNAGEVSKLLRKVTCGKLLKGRPEG